MVGKAPKPTCRMCPSRHPQVPAVRCRPLRVLKTKKHVSMSCGGSMCAVPMTRLTQAFLIAEQKNHCDSVEATSIVSERAISIEIVKEREK